MENISLKLKILDFEANYGTLHPAVELVLARLVPFIPGQLSQLTHSEPLDSVTPSRHGFQQEWSWLRWWDRSDSDAFLHRRAAYEQASARWR